MKMKDRFCNLIIRFAAVLFGTWYLVGGVLSAAADWPQWRGPNRDGISSETGFLKNWSQEGPKVLWHILLGDGYSGISIAQGKVYTMFAEGDDEFVICLGCVQW